MSLDQAMEVYNEYCKNGREKMYLILDMFIWEWDILV